ncbi:Kap104p [Lachancea thermotolerans CBS 6340]|uniref:KLTH0E16038p n=1 Tax=Lachancea thermotolerans (strain ATCC 56472 / CBS 6340 / NRRL Y-8284) TaxID=559295 RepID=C5DIY0_LACTC|nr:KLTH0E16038p [Lachancea thermotolerans CBS 6340]CAR23741.1 KLTH0E16038p [Lachancea thermotolerans CBS 6340]
MSSWEPDETSLMQIMSVIIDSMSPFPEKRSQAMEVLETFKLHSELWNYLCFLLTQMNSNSSLSSQLGANDILNCRAAAGMILKNCLLQNSREVDLSYIKENIATGLQADSPLVSNITGIVITTLFSTYFRKHRDDPAGVGILSRLLESTSHGSEASVKALSKIMEDNSQFFMLEWSNAVKPMETLVGSFLAFMTSDSSELIRAESIKCLNQVIPLQTQSFITRIDEFLSNLFQLAQNDKSELVISQICTSLVELLEFRPDKLIDHLNGIVHFVLSVVNTAQEEKVALEACEFLLAFASNTHIPENAVKPFVGDLVPTLLSKMVYNEEDILIFESSNETDADLEDKDEDIKPMNAKINKKRDGSYVDEDEDPDDDGDFDTIWNLRKCSAATLDVVTSILPRDVLPIAFPILREHLSAVDWYVREATILALGAMADGGMKYFSDQLPALIPFLVQKLKDPWAPVRTITCWTLSRFSTWILSDNTQFLLPVFEAIMLALMDKKKSVQEAAISSVAVFIENCDTELLETLLYGELLNRFNQCFQLYQKKNLIILYDAVGRLAEKCEFEETAMNSILPHLINKWASLSDNDKELWPLLECLSYVAASLGEKFAPMAPEVYSRAYRILVQCVELEARSQNDPSVEVPEKDFVVTSLDLIDGLVQGLGPASQDLLFPDGDKSTLGVLGQCLQDPVHEVRQSGFALLGDIAYFYDPSLLGGALVDFLKYISTELIHNDDSDATPTINNAVWALGLISERIDLAAFMIDLSRVVLDLFCDTTRIIHSSVAENLAITIGRMARFHAEAFTNGPFAHDACWARWCEHAMNIADPDEKAAAYGGFTKVLNITESTNTMSSSSLHKFIRGVSRDVDISDFAEDLYAFLMNHSDTLQLLKLSQDEMNFLAQFM